VKKIDNPCAAAFAHSGPTDPNFSESASCWNEIAASRFVGNEINDGILFRLAQ